MKNNIIKILLILFACIIVSCNHHDLEKIIKDDASIEFRDNFPSRNFYKRLILIEPTSKEFFKVQQFINNLNGFKQITESKEYSNYTIIGKGIKILIFRDKIHIIKKDKDKIQRFEKEISYQDYTMLISFPKLEWVYDFGNIYGKGKLKTASYIFCGISGVERKYEYKVGKWTFWNLDREFIGEGNFKINKRTVTNYGGCPYVVYESKISDDWYFINKEDKTDINLIYNIENARKLNFYTDL